MVTLTTPKYTLREARELLGMTVCQLSDESGIAKSTIWGIEQNSSEYGINIQTAELLAAAMALEVSEIQWPRPLSSLGRPPRTGIPIGRNKQVRVVAECRKCYTELPLSGNCDFCNP